MYHIMIGIQPVNRPIDGRFVTSRGLHGLLFNVLKQADPEEGTWLHGHGSPKPFAQVPYYNERGHLVGIRLSAVTDRTADLLINAWEHARFREEPLKLGRMPFFIGGLEWVQRTTFAELAENRETAHKMVLDFVAPTSFKSGPGSVPLPIPGSVFRWPWRVWDAFGPPGVLPLDVLDWCAQNVFVTACDIHTATASISDKIKFTGFVGRVEFTSVDRSPVYLRAWHSLGTLAAYCGVGHKTTMGMGAVEIAE